MGVLWVLDTAASAATVRRNLAYDLGRVGVDADVASDSSVLASELVANAVRHARALPSGHLQVEWAVTSEGVVVSVTDGGSDTVPEIREAGLQDTTGRGLAIVAALADEWGVDASEATTTVWARISTRAATAS
ncbi:MAG: ATP-binding protein [Jatrophihabitans sp.]